MDLGLEGLRAVLTGGSKGIGREIVRCLAREGCHVAFCARQQEGVDRTLNDLSGVSAKVYGGVADVADHESLGQWLLKSAERLGGLDILIANASALGDGVDEQSWRAGLEVDILGTVRAVELALPFLKQSRAAAIVGISSAAAINTTGQPRAYSGVKAALINYLSALSTNLGADGIRANTVSPGAIFFEGGVWDRRKAEKPDVYAAAVSRSPLKRLGSPEEVANAVVFLASPAASFISGTNLIVDGAATTRVQF